MEREGREMERERGEGNGERVGCGGGKEKGEREWMREEGIWREAK